MYRQQNINSIIEYANSSEKKLVGVYNFNGQTVTQLENGTIYIC